MSIKLNFCWSVPLEFLRSFLKWAIWVVDPYCWSTNLLMCMGESHRTICCFSCFDSLICWFWSILESTFCTVDPFCWQHDVTLSIFVESGLSSNHNSVRWTHFVDTIMHVIIQYTCEKSGQQIETRPSKFLLSDRQDVSWQIIYPQNISQWNISWENIRFKLCWHC